MTKIKTGFKLFQPWATEIVMGDMPFLIRSINTHIRDRVGIVALKKIDNNWIQYADNGWKNKIFSIMQEGVIGSVKIEDSVQVNKSELKKKLNNIAGEGYFENYYPKHLIPSRDTLFIWVLKNPKQWKTSINLGKIGGMTWVKLDFEDEYLG
jgi:hypothetical protein